MKPRWQHRLDRIQNAPAYLYVGTGSCDPRTRKKTYKLFYRNGRVFMLEKDRGWHVPSAKEVEEKHAKQMAWRYSNEKQERKQPSLPDCGGLTSEWTFNAS